MTATAPITQDVLTLPRKLPEGGKTNIVGLTRDQLRAALIAAGTPEKQAKMRLGQIWQWVYHFGIRDFAAMTNLAKDYRALLADHFVVEVPEVVSRQISADGTRKYLVRIAGGHEVETVYIPEETRGTLCISSQVGCTLTCSFCHTGTQKLVRNLTAGEIVAQIHHGQWRGSTGYPIRDVVNIGVGGSDLGSCRHEVRHQVPLRRQEPASLGALHHHGWLLLQFDRFDHGAVLAARPTRAGEHLRFRDAGLGGA